MVVPALGIGLACTAILNPRDDVERCGAATDCEGTGDKRYVVECRFEEGVDSTEVDGVCVAEFAQPSCNPANYANPEHPLTIALSMRGNASNYLCDTPELEGQLGCPPRSTDGGCAEGLAVVNGTCLVPGSDMVSLAVGGTELYGQDILDQFCRSYFCDEQFVCDRDSGFICVPCDPDEPFGNGGCGTVVARGAESCIYDNDDCDAPNSNVDKPNFGC